MRAFLFLVFGLFLAGCTHEPAAVAPTAGAYPEAIGKIITNRCLSCHNAANASQSGGLRLDTWANLFNGGTSGAVLVPFHLENSVFLHYINTYPDLGTVAQPTMPVNEAPLSRDEVLLFKNWVLAGAPDADGNAAFADGAETRQKIYITMQACDLLGVVDAQRQVVMRYIPVGVSPSIQEKPHAVRVSADGRYAYVTLSSGIGVQKIDTRTDAVVGTADLSSYAPGAVWNIVHLSDDGKQFAISNYTAGGGVYIVNTETMKVTAQFDESGLFNYPHAIVSNAAFDTFYVTGQNGNTIYRFSPVSQSYRQISLDGQAPNSIPGRIDPHEIMMTPDGSAYFVTCQASNDVRVVDARTDSVLAVIPVGSYPQELALSNVSSLPYMFVTCQEDASQRAGFKGSVYVINYKTMQVVKRIDGPFWQPHGITVDGQNGVVYVASRNATSNGIAPHHAGACGGRNGWYSLIDLATLEPIGTKRFEVSEEPYSADVRFKTPQAIQ